MKHKVIALTAALSMLGGSIAALPAMAADVSNPLSDDFESYDVGSSCSPWESWGGTLSIEGDGTNQYLALTQRKFDTTGAGQMVTFSTGSTYKIEFDAKTVTETQNFTMDAGPGATVLFDNRTVEADGSWHKVTGSITVNASEQDEYTDRIWFQTASWDVGGTNSDFYLDNIKIYKETEDPGETNVAEINGVQYTSLDAAITAATNNDTVTVLKDTELSSVVTKPITLKGANGILPTVTIKAATGDTTALFAGDTTLENIVLTGGEASATSETPQYGRLVSEGGSLTINNSTIKNLAFKDDSYGTFNFENVTFSGIYKHGWFLRSTGESSLKHVTATDNQFVDSWVGFIQVDSSTTFESCTIKDNNIDEYSECRAMWISYNGHAKLNGNNDLSTVAIGNNGTLTIDEPSPMALLQVDDTAIETYKLNLNDNFMGQLRIELSKYTPQDEKVIAAVENGAVITGIKVDGLADTQELKVIDGKLVIAEKAAPAEFTATVGTAEVQHGTGEFENTVATGFRATVTNNGGTMGTFKTVKWNVTLGDDTKTTGYQEMKTTVTLYPSADAEIFLIVDGLGDKNATATVKIK